MRGKYKNKIFYVITCIVVCSTILLIFNYSLFMTKQYLTQYDQNILDKVDAKGNQLSKSLSDIDNRLMNIKMSEEVSKFSQATRWQDMHLQAINVQNKIKKETIYQNDLKYTVAITFLDERELIVSNDMTSQKYLFFENKGIDRLEVDKLYEKLHDNKVRMLSKKSVDIRGEVYIHYFTKFNYNGLQLLYITSINEKNLLDLIEDDVGSYYIFDKEEIIVKNQEKAQAIQAIHDKTFPKYKQDYPIDLDKTSKLYKYKGTKVIFKPLHELGWTLAYSYETKLIQIRGLIIGGISITGIASIIGLLIIRLSTENLYKPVKKLLEEMGKKSTVEEKNTHNEFEYISYYNKSIEEENSLLSETIKKNKNIIKEKYYKELLNGIRAYKKDDYKEYYKKNEIGQVVLLEFENINQRLEDEQTFIIKQNIKKEVIAFKYIQYVNIDYKTCCLIIKDDLEINTIKKTILQIISKIEDCTNLNMKSSIGSKVQDVDELHESFLQAKKQMEFKNAFPNKVILTGEDIGKLNFTATTFPLRVENKLITSTIHGEEDTLMLLDQLLEENLRDVSKSEPNKKNFVLAMIVALNRIFDQMSVVPQNYLGDCYKEYENLYGRYTGDIALSIKCVFEYIINEVRARDVQDKQDMAQQMLDYIHKNYPEDIMLEDMAATLDISVKYCSVLFKRMTGENFKAMLNQYRIEKAKELLETKEIKVSEVALQVGFNSPNTFIRVFNKYVGMSPGVYQENNVKEPNK